MLVGDRLSVYQASSNWTAVRLQWRRGTAGAFWLGAFLLSGTSCGPNCQQQPLMHIPHPLSLVVFIQYFKWIALQKSTQAQAITCGHKERCSWKLLHWLRQKKNTHMPLPASGAFIKPLISLLTFSLRRLTLPTLMPRVVPAWNWPCLTPEAGSGPWWQEEVPQWCTGKIPKDQTP